MVGGVGRGLAEDLASQRDPLVEILLADRLEGLDDRDFIQGHSLLAEHLGQMVDVVETVSLVEQSHQPASERRLDIPQLDRAEVILDRLVGRTGELGELAVQGRAAHQSGCRSEIWAASTRASSGPRELHGGPCRSRERLRETPVAPLVAFDLADLAHELGGVVLVTGFDGQVEQPEPDTSYRARGPLARDSIAAPGRFAEPDLGHGEPVEKRGTVGSRDLLAGLRQLGHSGLGRVAPLQAPVVQACQLNSRLGPRSFSA